jgi:hypothetical protein
MDLLSDDIFHHVLSFLPSRRDIANVALTNSRAFRYLHHADSANSIFKNLWQAQFGTSGDRQSFHSLYYLPKFVQQNSTATPAASTKSSPCHRTAKIGLLSAAQERAALRYDNGHDDGNATCMGYFGMELLWDDGPVVVWGDFAGVRVFSHGITSLLHLPIGAATAAATTTKPRGGRAVIALGDDESHVLTVVPWPERKLFFVGFSSGKVMCIQAELSSSTNQYSYSYRSSASHHTNEVTSLCFLPCLGLVSASVDGNVYIYPNASLDGSLDNAICIFQVGNPVLTMATILHKGRSFIVTGDQGAHISLWWEVSDNDWRHAYSSVDEQCVPTETIVWSTNSELYVIVGASDGRLLCWRVDDLWELERMDDRANGWNGCRPIECLCVLGNLLLVGAGRKLGLFALPDVRQDIPMFIGSPLPCHPKPKHFASVVSCIPNHAQQSLITLCRDGTLREWTWKSLGGTKEPLLLQQKRKRGGSAATTTNASIITKVERRRQNQTFPTRRVVNRRKPVRRQDS